MRLLYLPLYSNKNLSGDSSYNVAVEFISSAVNRGWFVHWVLPKIREGGFHYSGERAAIEHHPRVLVHRVSSMRDQYLQSGVVPADMLYYTFGQHEGKYHIDAVLTERTASANFVRKLLQHPFTRLGKGEGTISGKTPELPVFVRDPFTKNNDVHVSVSEVEELEQSVGYLLNHPVFMSRYDHDLAISAAKKYLNYGMVRDLMKRSVVIPSGTATTELRKIREDVVKRDRFSILISERLKGRSKMMVLDAADYMFARGHDVDVIISSQGDINKYILRRYPRVFEHAQVFLRNPRSEYLPLAASCHAVITMPATHSYPQGLMEQLVLGLVAVLPDFPWVDSVLPGYPFKVKRNIKEMVGMLKWMQENYEEACKRIEWVPEYIEKNYESCLMSETLMQHIETTMADSWDSSKSSSGYTELLESLPVDEVDESELAGLLNEYSDMKLSFDNSELPVGYGQYRSKLFQAMRYAGWEDTCEGPFVTMRRVSK